MKVIVLAAGKGERLRHIVKDVPRPMINVKGKGMIKSNDNVLKAKLIKIEFDDKDDIQSVYGEGEIGFKKENISYQLMIY